MVNRTYSKEDARKSDDQQTYCTGFANQSKIRFEDLGHCVVFHIQQISGEIISRYIHYIVPAKCMKEISLFVLSLYWVSLDSFDLGSPHNPRKFLLNSTNSMIPLLINTQITHSFPLTRRCREYGIRAKLSLLQSDGRVL